jgi:hypothetical protein
MLIVFNLINLPCMLVSLAIKLRRWGKCTSPIKEMKLE